MLNSTVNQTFTSLLDIASNIQIESNFRIYHPNYQPLILPTKIAERFQQNPLELQEKYLTLLLRNFVYGIYFHGSLKNILALNAPATNYPAHQSLENNSSWGIDEEFSERLHNCNHGRGYFDPCWEVLRREPDGSMAVSKGGLTLYIEPDSHLKPMSKSATVGELVSVGMPKNRWQNGCYLAVSDYGQELQNSPDADLGTGRIYFNFSASGAIAFMDRLTLELNDAGIAFSFQVLYNPSAYGRYDSGVLYFEGNDYPAIRKVLQAVYSENESHFHPEIPLFTKFLAPGLGFAEEPTQKFTAQESFGINRCQIVAKALLEAQKKGQNTLDERMKVIEQHFALHLIDLQHPYLNPGSEDIYYPLK